MLGILEHAFASIGIARVNAEHFPVAIIRVDTEGAVVHPKPNVIMGEFPKAVSDIDMTALGAVLRTQDQELAGIVIVSEVAAVGVVIVSAISSIPPKTLFGMSLAGPPEPGFIGLRFVPFRFSNPPPILT